ncbi:ROK family transcriptional regulator [Paenibacillus antarcticus]|uniref:Sugar kinase n=1 Tax=Paenibacillus antarcticus TaxID=253703 RepID=A0A168QLJ1_9BACL|nr:ROK family transcriptional regulator [Paenibacillus antarcticus]OAB47926.1 sugar kinase [Paenibacillus antarcticus]
MEKRSTFIPSPKKLLYDRIAEEGTVSKSELLTAFSLTKSTMTRLLDEMTHEGLLIESGFGQSSGGRRPILYQINPSYGYILGLEVSRVYSSLGLFDMQMNPKSIIHWRMDEAFTPENFLEHISTHSRAFLRDHQLIDSQIIGVGIGAVGPLDRKNGMILQPLHFPAAGWNNLPICKLVEERTGFKAWLDNGANAALLGERWAIRHTNIQHMLYVHAGAGLRSSMMSHGGIVHGTMDMEDAIGQMIIQTDGPQLHNNGNYGALEAFVSVQALEQRARSEAKLGRDLILKTYKVSAEQLTYDVLVQAFRDGDPLARELFTQAAVHFGIGLANVINLFHPETIILGGALIHSHELFFQTAAEVAQKNIYRYPEYSPHFSLGKLKEEAVVTGAAIMVRDHMVL